MVGDNGDRVGSAGEILAPLRQRMYDRKEFSVIDIVVSFGGRKGFREVGARVEISVEVFLHEYTSGCGEGGVGHDKEGFVMIREREYWLFQERFLYFCEGDLVVY